MVNDDEAGWGVGGRAAEPSLNPGDLARCVSHWKSKDLIPTFRVARFA
jgi:hypothetical protein